MGFNLSNRRVHTTYNYGKTKLKFKGPQKIILNTML